MCYNAHRSCSFTELSYARNTACLFGTSAVLLHANFTIFASESRHLRVLFIVWWDVLHFLVTCSSLFHVSLTHQTFLFLSAKQIVFDNSTSLWETCISSFVQTRRHLPKKTFPQSQKHNHWTKFWNEFRNFKRRVMESNQSAFSQHDSICWMQHNWFRVTKGHIPKQSNQLPNNSWAGHQNSSYIL